jgi:hypothetical protein
MLDPPRGYLRERNLLYLQSNAVPSYLNINLKKKSSEPEDAGGMVLRNVEKNFLFYNI